MPPHPDSLPIPLRHAYRLLNHGPVVLLSTSDGERPNVAPIAWLTTVDFEPPLFALVISDGHRTYKNLHATGELVINLPGAELLEAVRISGTLTGNEHPDKLGAAGLSACPSQVVGAPRIAECLAWIEARLRPQDTCAPDQPILVEAVAASARPGVLDEHWYLQVERFPTLHHLGGLRFMTPGRVLTAGRPQT